MESLESRQLLAAIPATSLGVPSEGLLGESMTVHVGFSNVSPSDTGYGPYVDVILPATGADGTGVEIDDGITFAGATYQGQFVATDLLTFDALGEAVHPFAQDNAGNPVIVTGTPGDQLIVIQLPFGSYTPGQPVADVEVTVNMSNLADAGAPLAIQARGGFRFGNDPLDNPLLDPSILETPFHASSTTPVVYRLSKAYSGPENETATGPNYPRQYTVSADIAAGVTLTLLELTDALPHNLQFVRVDSTLVHGVATATDAVSTPGTTAPGGILTRRFASVTGASGADDATMTFTYYVPRNDSAAGPVLDPASGDDAVSNNEARSAAQWTPADPRDPPTSVSVNPPGPEHVLTDKSIAIQKNASIANDVGATGPTPGDTIEYQLAFQISDYFSFGDLQVTDIFSDGQRLDGLFTPQFSITDRNGTVSGTFTLGGSTPDWTVDLSQIGNDTDPATDGSTRLLFDISQALINAGAADGILQGGRSTGSNAAGATGTIVFRTTIQEQFSDTYLPNTPNVSEGDVLNNGVTIGGSIRDNGNLSSVLGSEQDTSTATVSVITGTLSKVVYAVNGNTSLGSPIRVAPGDEVTYRFTYEFPMTDFDGLSLTDYLPLPVFDATTLVSFDPTVDGVAPAPGTLKTGPSDTFHARTGLTPSISTSAASNSFTVAYAAYDDPASLPSTLDLMATFVVSATPFADELLLTNQIRAYQNTTNSSDLVIDNIVQVTLTEPVVQVTKGAVATDGPNGIFSPPTVGPVPFSAPGGLNPRFSGTIHSTNLSTAPIRSDLAGIDAGDLVTFTIVLENTGTGLNGAFDTRLRDTIPTGFSIPSGGLNLSVTDGTGAPLLYTDLGGGLLGSGIELTDTGATGALAPAHPTNGLNIAVITYDLQADAAVEAASTLRNTATLLNYAGQEGGPDHTTTDLTDFSETTITSPSVAKSTAATEGTIGDLITYNLAITVPEGTTPGAAIVDTLDSGLAFVDLLSVAASDPADVSWASPVVPTVTNNGRTISFDLGTIVNADRDNSIAETVTLTYRAVVLNVLGNQEATTLDNSAVLNWSHGALAPVSAGAIKVVEPSITTTKAVTVVPGGTTGDAGDAVQYVITLQNSSPVDAWDATFSDALPVHPGSGSLIALPLFSINDTAGVVTSAGFEMVGDDTNGWTLRTRPGVTFDMPADPARTITITISGTLSVLVQPGENISNYAATSFTSQNGDPGTISPYNSNATERTGADGPGPGLNNYATTGTAQLRIYDPTPAKSLVVTSENSTGSNNVTIGEIARYRLEMRLAEGTAPDFQIVEQIPAGLRFLDDGTAKVALVSNLGNISSSTLAGAGLTVVGNQSTLAAITPTFVLPATAIAGGPFASGTDLSLNLGTLLNPDSDADSEYVVVEFNGLVENVAGNQSGQTLNNLASVRVAGSAAGSTSNLVGVSVVEPSVTDVTKTVLPNTGDAGDTVSYRITFSNPAIANVTTAFDLQVIDVLPSTLTLNPASVAITASGATGVVDNTSGNTVRVDIGSLVPGGTMQVDFDAVLRSNVQPQQQITNTADVAYTSLPGTGTSSNPTGSTTPGIPGSQTGERNGAGGINNYSDADSAIVTVTSPDISKIILSTNQASTSGNNVVIGEIVEYELTFSVVEGTSTSVIVSDQFPAGMALVSLDAITAAPTLSTTHAGGFPGALADATVSALGTDFTIDLDTLTNSDTDNATVENIRITFSAVVLNVAANQDGLSLVNTATVSYASGSVTTTAPAVDVVEPVLSVTKSPSAASGDAGGAAITYTVVVAHDPASTADAFDIALEDILPLGLDYVASTLAYVSGIVPTWLVAASNTVTAGFDLFPLGSTSTFQFDATINDAAVPSQVVVNTADVRHTSLPGAVTTPQSTYNSLSTERTGNTSDPGGPTNDYTTNGAGSVAVRSNALAGFVYDDANHNGTHDSGEAGIGGVAISLTGTDNLGNAVSQSITTAVDGGYTFADLRPGDYRIEEAQPAGYLDGDESVGTQGGTALNDRIDVVLPVGTETSGTENNFGELAPASIAGTVYRDTNNDGTQQSAETGISAVTFQLTGIDDRGNSVDRTTTSDSAGAFRFQNLRPGTYALAETQPAALLDGLDAIGTQGGTLANDLFSDIVLSPGTSGTGNLFGELEPASLSGRVYEDPNDNGAIDSGEAGISGVTVTLTGVDDLGGNVNLTTTTASDGVFVFGNLRPGTYQLDETQPTSPFYFDGIDTVGLLGGLVGNDQFSSIAVVPGDAGTDYLFGELPPADPVGYVFVDVNDNGQFDATEPPVPGVTITVTGTDDLGQPVNLTDTTDSAGFYQFQYLRPGTYRITETQPAGYIDGQEQNGTPPAIVGNDFFAGLTLTWGQLAGDYNFGERAFGSLAGQVYVDANRNGRPDPFEMSIPGVTITLTGVDFGGGSVSLQTTTDAAGIYLFSNLALGQYRITETQPAGFLDGLDRVGSLGGVLQPDAVDQIFLNANQAGVDYDFGENGLLPNSITKRFFLARNRRV